MARMWQERANYGHFFYRIPNGESAADAYDRISGFNESLWRSFGEDDFASVCVLVTHGLMTRVFLMKWYHFSVEYFEDLRNVNHCEFIVMRRKEDSGKYVLQNQLRTWSELRREQKMRERQHGGEPASPEIPVRKKWVGCRDEDEGDASVRRVTKILPRRQNTADLFNDGGGGEDADAGGEDHAMQMPHGQPKFREKDDLAPSLLSPIDFLKVSHTGRDGGGTLSGAGSEEDTEDSSGDSAKDAIPRNRSARTPGGSSLAMALKGDLIMEGEEPMKADALGDQSDVEENNPTASELRRMKREDQSFEGSVR